MGTIGEVGLHAPAFLLCWKKGCLAAASVPNTVHPDFEVGFSQWRDTCMQHSLAGSGLASYPGLQIAGSGLASFPWP